MNLGATSVYRYFNAAGVLLYVGVTCRGTRRMSEHADTKAWWPMATTCTVEHYEDRETALGREAYLIATLQPPYNKQGRKAKNVLFVGPPTSGRMQRVTAAACGWCGAHAHVSRLRGLCRDCEGRRGTGATQSDVAVALIRRSQPQVEEPCRACDQRTAALSRRGLCRSCEGKAGRIIQQIKESA